MVLTLKDILGRNIFVPGDNKERLSRAMEVVDFAIFSSFSKIESHHSDLRGLFTTSSMRSGVGGSVGRLISLLTILLGVTDLIEYGYIFLEVCYKDTFIFEGCGDVNLVKFFRELLTGDSFHNMLHRGWLFSTNAENTKIVYFYFR